MPAGSTLGTLEALGTAVADSGARRLIVLGDLWHARSGRTQENRQALALWLSERPDLQTLLVIGNHDLRSGWELEAVDPGMLLPPFALHHHPEPDSAGYVLCGHVHPSVRLNGLGGQSLRLPCFHFGSEVGVLPAFGELTGTAEVLPEKGDRTVVVAEGKVAIVPTRDRSNGRRR